MPEEIREPTGPELDWIAGYVEAADDLAGRHLATPSGPLAVDGLDALWAAWVGTDPAPAEAQGVIHAVGLAFGQVLVDDLGMRWVVVQDHRGSEMAVTGRHAGGGTILLRPAELVAQRWPGRETGFLQPLLQEVVTAMLDPGAPAWLSGGR